MVLIGNITAGSRSGNRSLGLKGYDILQLAGITLKLVKAKLVLKFLLAGFLIKRWLYKHLLKTDVFKKGRRATDKKIIQT